MTKFKIGDKVRCKPGYNASDSFIDGLPKGGSGYKEGKEFTINKFSSKGQIAWNRSGAAGVWIHALELTVTPLYKIY